MFNKTKIAKTKIALCVAIVLGGAASSALASNDNDGGNETGGYVVSGSMDGVNPAYHREMFGRPATKAFGLAVPTPSHPSRKKTPMR